MGWDRKTSAGPEAGTPEEASRDDRRRFLTKSLSAVPIVLTVRSRSYSKYGSYAGSLWSSGHHGNGGGPPGGWKFGDAQGQGPADQPPGWDWSQPRFRRTGDRND